MDMNLLPLTDEQRDAQFCAAFEQLNTLVDWAQFDLDFPRRENAVFSTSLVMCLFLYQHMCPDKSLELVVKKLLKFAPKLLPAHHKRVREGTLSSDPSGYAKARKKCPLKAVQNVAQTVSETLISHTTPSLNGRRVIFFDGTTITLAPDSDLHSVYPPARNQFGGKPIRASKQSAEWCIKSVDQCWSKKAGAIREPERATAKAAYDFAKAAYEKALRESVAD